jgi:hypothetical protein
VPLRGEVVPVADDLGAIFDLDVDHAVVDGLSAEDVARAGVALRGTEDERSVLGDGVGMLLDLDVDLARRVGRQLQGRGAMAVGVVDFAVDAGEPGEVDVDLRVLVVVARLEDVVLRVGRAREGVNDDRDALGLRLDQIEPVADNLLTALTLIEITPSLWWSL